MSWPTLERLAQCARDSLLEAALGRTRREELGVNDLLETPPERLRRLHDRLARQLASKVVGNFNDVYPEELAIDLLKLEQIARLVGRRHIYPWHSNQGLFCSIIDLPEVDEPKNFFGWIDSAGGPLTRHVNSCKVGDRLEGQLIPIGDTIKHGRLRGDPNNLLRAYIWPDEWGGDVVDIRREVMAKKWQSLVKCPQFPLDPDHLLAKEDSDQLGGKADGKFLLGVGFWGDGCYVPDWREADRSLEFFGYKNYKYYVGLKLLMPLVCAAKGAEVDWLAVDKDGQLCKARGPFREENVWTYDGIMSDPRYQGGLVVATSNVLRPEYGSSLGGFFKFPKRVIWHSPMLDKTGQERINALLFSSGETYNWGLVSDWWDDTLHSLFKAR